MGADSAPKTGGSQSLDGIMCRADIIGAKYQSHHVALGASRSGSRPKSDLKARKKFTKEYGRVVHRVQRFKEATNVRIDLGPTLSEKKAKEMDKNLRDIQRDILKTDIPALLRLANSGRSFLCVIAAPSCEEDVEERKHMVMVLKSWVEDTGGLFLDSSETADDSRSDSTVASASEAGSSRVQSAKKGVSPGAAINSLDGSTEAGLDESSTDDIDPKAAAGDSPGDSPLTSPRAKADPEDIRRKAAQQNRLQALQRREALRNQSRSQPAETGPKYTGQAEDPSPSTPVQPVKKETPGSRPHPSTGKAAADSAGPGSRHSRLGNLDSSTAPTKLFDEPSAIDKEDVSGVDAQVAAEAALRAEALKKSREQSQKAREELRQKQKEQQLRQSALWESTSETSDVGACVAKLRALKGDAQAFVDMVYKEYPPKDGRTKFDKGNLKKTVQRAISHYHPDKQDEVAHGPDWITICDEICKELTRIYTKM